MASVGVGVSLAAQAEVAEDAFLAQEADTRGSKIRENVAVTGAGAVSLSLPAHLAHLPLRDRPVHAP